jgi:hypothetical protein
MVLPLLAGGVNDTSAVYGHEVATTLVGAAPLAVADEIANVDAVEVPPPGAGLVTVMFALPAVAMSDAGTAALNCEALAKVVGSAVPFQLTVEVDTKLLPLTVSENAAPPAVAPVGAMPAMVGAGLVLTMVNTDAPDDPPPGAGELTVTLAVPAPAMSLAGTDAVSCASLMNVVVSAVPFQLTVEDATKPVPLTVSVNALPPAVVLAGARLLMAGTGLLLVIDSVNEAEVPPPGDGLVTETLALPALAISAAGTVAVRRVELA